jgi:hypothetical protein
MLNMVIIEIIGHCAKKLNQNSETNGKDRLFSFVGAREGVSQSLALKSLG